MAAATLRSSALAIERRFCETGRSRLTAWRARGPTINLNPRNDQLEAARAAARRAESLADGLSARDRLLIRAMIIRTGEGESFASDAYASFMESAALRMPQDDTLSIMAADARMIASDDMQPGSLDMQPASLVAGPRSVSPASTTLLDQTHDPAADHEQPRVDRALDPGEGRIPQPADEPQEHQADGPVADPQQAIQPDRQGVLVPDAL